MLRCWRSDDGCNWRARAKEAHQVLIDENDPNAQVDEEKVYEVRSVCRFMWCGRSLHADVRRPG